MDYSKKYHFLLVDINEGIAVVTLNRPEVLNACNNELHHELGVIWKDLDEDKRINVIIVTGAGKAFCSGGSMDLIESIGESTSLLYELLLAAQALVHNMINCSKPIISAINGVAVGAGLALALMADIPIAADVARFNDGHTRLGVACGDHSCLIWPFLTSMAKAKFYLFTGRTINATEAEKMGMVSTVVPLAELMPTAQKIAKEIASGPQHAIRFTKLAMNQHLRQAAITSFDYSCALEMLGFLDKDVIEGVKAIRERRKPVFPSAKL